MKKTWLLTAALLCGPGLAFAQNANPSKEGAAPAPPALQNAPAEQIAPPMKETQRPQAPQAGDNAAPKMDSGRASGSPQQDTAAGDKGATSGQGAASAAKLSTEQRSKITAAIKQKNMPKAEVNFSVSVGTRVPRTVHLHPMPAEVIAVYPDWRSHQFIMVGNQIVVIDPVTLEIVAVIDA